MISRPRIPSVRVEVWCTMTTTKKKKTDHINTNLTVEMVG